MTSIKFLNFINDSNNNTLHYMRILTVYNALIYYTVHLLHP